MMRGHALSNKEGLAHAFLFIGKLRRIRAASLMKHKM
jgi:hypothetical protein